ncbi:TrbG/VirB9 family P-type conjugative transfer protein [Methylocapsa sp. S129]|uniref:TrbG/VirB9 family P-type conjugative transfer protein n=1 Tax=Methylocapsa sp. S129 TaxID=1641869 RepID=UPI00352B9650
MYPFSKGALHRGYDAPGEIPDIALEPGEPRAGSGPVATGDTLYWIVCDIESGAKTAKRVRFVVKPTRPDLTSNLIVNTDHCIGVLDLFAGSAIRPAATEFGGVQARRRTSEECSNRPDRREAAAGEDPSRDGTPPPVSSEWAPQEIACGPADRQ